MASQRRPKGSGAVRQLPSGRWQAKVLTPDGKYATAPSTFDTKLDANAWLKGQARDLARGTWQPPEKAQKAGTLAEYAANWLETRELKPRSRYEYRQVLQSVLLPALGDLPLERISPTVVRNWYASLDPTKPTRRAHSYSLLRTILSTAVSDDLIPANPCRIRGAGSVKTKHEPKIASLADLAALVEAIPPRYEAMVLLAAWCGLRFGELTELRRTDVDLADARLHVRRGVTRADGQWHVGDPKSQAGKRPVTIPPHLVPLVQAHLDQHVDPASDALLFPARNGGHMSASTLQRVWEKAREQAGRPDLRFHDLRHTGATLAAATGATLAELMARLGHSTVSAALRYQHSVSEDRDRAIAAALSGYAEGNVVPLRHRSAG